MPRMHICRSQLAWQGRRPGPRRLRAHPSCWPAAARSELTLSNDRQLELPDPRAAAVGRSQVRVSCCGSWTWPQTGLDVLAYEDDAEAIMPEDAKPMRHTRVTLRPRIAVAPGTGIGQIAELVERAHRCCHNANSLNTKVIIEPRKPHRPGQGVKSRRRGRAGAE
jgi:hypothetical protein